MKNLSLAILFGLSILAEPLLSATYHVTKNGSDQNNGSASSPWLTVQHAANQAKAGDTVLIGAGFFDEVVRIHAADGTARNRIVFDGQGVAQVYRMVVQRPYVTLRNLEFKWPNTQEGFSQGFVSLERGAHHCTVSNNFINATGSTSHEGIRWDVGRGPFDPTAASFCTLVSNVITGVRGQVAILIGGTSNLIEGNLVTNVIQADFLRLWGENNIIRGNTFSNNVPQEGLGFHPDFVQTFGNTGRGSRHHLIERNKILDHQGQLTQLVEGTAAKPELIGTGALRDWTFRNNIFCNTKLGSSITIPETKWYNNVFYKVNLSGGGALGGSQSDRGTSAGIRVLNNVFLDCGIVTQDNTGWYRVNFDYDDRVQDYNYVAKNNYRPVREECPLVSEFRWCEAHGINGGDALFYDPENYDFRLREGSPLIGKGVPIPGFNDDFSGNVRPTGQAWDIGAFQHLSSSRSTALAPPESLRLVLLN